MSTKTINIDYPSISASTTNPNVLANTYIQEVIAGKVYNAAVASDNSTSLLVNAQPAGHPAIPGLYKRVSDVSNIVEEKDAFVSSYFQDLTYVAPTQYVGTLTLI